MMGGLKPETMDDFIHGNQNQGTLAMAGAVSGSPMIGDIIRYANSANIAQHFTTFLYFEGGKPHVFSQSRTGGPFLHGLATNFEGVQENNPDIDYGNIRGIGPGESGYYRPE
jgi:hypothetical protein